VQGATIGFFNVNGLPRDTTTNKFTEISNLIRSHDIFAIVETRTNEIQTFMQHHPNHLAFSTRVSAAGRAGQGIALIINKKIANSVRLWRISEDMQALWVEVDGAVVGLSEKVMLGVMYVPPVTANRSQADVAACFAAVGDEFALAKERSDHVIVLGDFNAHLGDTAEPFGDDSICLQHCPTLSEPRLCSAPVKIINHAGNCLLDLLAAYDCIATTGRGRGDTGQASCRLASRTDHILMSLKLFQDFRQVSFPVYSISDFDHCPISLGCFPSWIPGSAIPLHVCDESCTREVLKWVPESQQRYSMHILNDVEIHEQFEQAIQDEAVDLASFMLVSLVENAARDHDVGMTRRLVCPLAVFRRTRSTLPSWFDASCLNAKRTLQASARAGMRGDEYRQAKTRYRQLVLRTKRTFLKTKANAFMDKLKHMPSHAMKGLMPKPKRTTTPVSASDWETHVAELFMGTKEPVVTEDTGDAAAVDAVAAARAANFIMPTMAEITELTHKHLVNLNTDTAPGLDGLYAPFIKQAFIQHSSRSDDRTPVLTPLLGKLFFLLLTKGGLPRDWKIARMSPLHKKGTVTVASNYRMLAVSSVLYRLYTNVLKDICIAWCQKPDVQAIPASQFGFYPGRNAQQAQFILRHAVHLRQKGGRRPADKHLFAAFIDFKQAYDSVDRTRLWEHLRTNVGLPPVLLRAFKALYEGDSYIVVDGTKRSDPIFPQKGVKQGCPLSPLLFSMFINDLKITEVGLGVKLKSPDGNEVFLTDVLYADDLALLGEQEVQVQRMLDLLKSYVDSKGLVVNIEKCRVMCFNQGGIPVQVQLRYDGALIKQVEDFRYLGMVFTSDLDLRAAAEAWGPSLYASRRAALKVAYEMGVECLPHVMIRLFETFVRPHTTYASQVWATPFLTPGDALSCPLQSRYLGFLKHILKVKRTVSGESVMSETCQAPLQYFWIKSCATFWEACLKSNSTLLADVCISDVRLASSNPGCWSAQMDRTVRRWDSSCRVVDHGSPSSLDVTKLLNGWRAHWKQLWVGYHADPRLHGTDNRKRAAYSFYCRDEKDMMGGKHLPQYLKAGFSLNVKAVQAMSRLRLSDHNLRVEKGRHTGIPYGRRTCLRCAPGSNQVDDEHHLLFQCTSTSHLRQDNRFRTLFPCPDVCTLMHHDDYICVSLYVQQCMKIVDARF